MCGGDFRSAIDSLLSRETAADPLGQSISLTLT